MTSHNEITPFGSARWASHKQAEKIGLFRFHENAHYSGHLGKHNLYFNGDGGVLDFAGARAGKGTCFIIQNICAGLGRKRTQIILACKGDLPQIAANQTADNKSVYCWNLEGRDGLLLDSLNPLEPLTASSPTLQADIKTVVQGLIPPSGDGKAKYFEGRARDVMEGLLYALTLRDGEATLPALYHVINLALIGGAGWSEFADDMSAAASPLCFRIRKEIEVFQADPHGAMKDIIGEVTNAVSCLSDPNLMRVVSPPFSCSIADDLCGRDRFANLFIVCEAERMVTHAPIIKAMLSALFVTKARKPDAPRQEWVLDECALLGGFDLVPKLFSYGAGLGIRPWAIFQNPAQMDVLGHKARQIIMASAQLQRFYGIREPDTARLLSEMIGDQTLEIDDELVQGRADVDRRKLWNAVMHGADPFAVVKELHQKEYETTHKRKLRRRLVNPDEIRHLPNNRHLIFTDGLSGPLLAERTPYWQQRWMVGRYLGDPYHPPTDSVVVQTRWGARRRPVLTEPVPQQFAHLPQYRDGTWSYIGGYP